MAVLFSCELFHRLTIHRRNVTYMKHTKLLHLYNLNWKTKLNSKQVYHIFYATPSQPEIKSNNTLHNSNTTYKILLFINMCHWNRYRQYHSMVYSLNIIFVKLVENSFRCLHLRNTFSDNIILHYTSITWSSRHLYKLIIGFYICTTLHGSTLHSHNLIFTTFVQRDFGV